MKQIWTKYSYYFTIFFFILGFFNIIFAWAGFFCLIMPFVFAAKDKKNSWCQGYCPRANFFIRILNLFSFKGKNIPKWLTNGQGKQVILIYFSVNLFMVVMSTIMVFLDRREALDKIRFLIAFQLPWDIPQLLQIGVMPDWTIHLSFRIYSMMFTTTILGLLLGLLYKPKSWCAICPMGTLANMSLKKNKEQAAQIIAK